jgi:hypothetical protein
MGASVRCAILLISETALEAFLACAAVKIAGIVLDARGSYRMPISQQVTQSLFGDAKVTQARTST